MNNKYFQKLKSFISTTKEVLSQEKTKVLMRSNKKYFMSGMIVIFTICFFVFDLGGLVKNAWTNLSHVFSNVEGEVKKVVIKSTGYDNQTGGSVKVTKSVDWTSSSTAQMIYEVDTIVEKNNITKDIVLVLDTSASMEGSKLTRMKTALNELVTELLKNSGNRVSIITFNTTSKILTPLTNNGTTLTSEINGINVTGDTNYYQALVKVEEVLEGYEQEENRELIILFLTDGYPNIDSPNQVGQYKIIKEKHPYAKVYGIDYETGNKVIEELKKISEKQFVSDGENNKLLEAALTPEYYEKLEIIEYIDNEYFYITGEEDIEVTTGEVRIVEESGVQKIIWSAPEGTYGTGTSAQMKINLKLKGNKIGVEGLYPTSKKEEIKYNLYGQTETKIVSEDITKLKNGYKVTYIANVPSGCNDTINLKETHYAHDNVEITDEELSCEGYEFKGWEVLEEISDIEYINDKTFKMPTYNVIVRAKWTKLELNKTMDGKVYEKLTLYKAISDQAVMDNVKSKYVSSTSGINFAKTSSDTNGKGVYTIASTAKDEYPIHYFRGAVTNNNVLFAGYCWKIIRTTETGGVKLIYNGKPTSDNKCTNTTGTSTQLTTKSFNSVTTELARVGYMLDNEKSKNWAFKSPGIQRSRVLPNVLTMTSSSNYYYSTTISYDGTKYVLGSDATQYTWESNYNKLSGYYTCLSTSTTCSTAYYVSFGTSNKMYYSSFSNGKLLNDVDDLVISKNITSNGNGTFNFVNPIIVKRSEWFINYSNYSQYYVCISGSSTACTTTEYSSTPYNYGYEGMAIKDYIFANSFTYDAETNLYTLVSTPSYPLLSVYAWPSSYTKLSNYHYTCFNNQTQCSNLSYVFITEDTNANAIQLKNGKTLEDAFNESWHSSDVNKDDSTIKAYIDDWYKNNMTNYTKYIENTIYCNDRSIGGLGGWNPNGGPMNTRLTFGANKRAEQRTPSLTCPNKNDSFTLNKEAGGAEGYGNNALTYPVGLITSDEVMYAGAREGVTNKSYYLYTGQPYWSMSPYYVGGWGYVRSFGIDASGNLVIFGVQESKGVRPVISLMPDIEYKAGDGSAQKPYIILTD